MRDSCGYPKVMVLVNETSHDRGESRKAKENSEVTNNLLALASLSVTRDLTKFHKFPRSKVRKTTLVGK